MDCLSVNGKASALIDKLCTEADIFRVKVKKAPLGATLIDAGLEAEGGFLAGKIITEIGLGGLGETEILSRKFGDIRLPSISVYTDNPAVATLGSQLAGWKINVDGYSAIGSGPARALSLKPKSIFKAIDYVDRADIAILILESNSEPTEKTVEYISDLCKVKPENLYLILVPTVSTSGFTQVSGRIVETGIYKLMQLGLDPKKIKHAWGCAPIMPIHPDPVEAMGRVNDAIIYGGEAYYAVYYDDDDELEELTEKAVSSASKEYGKPFKEIFKEADLDFYRIDPALFAPATITINNLRTGRVFAAGEINFEVLEGTIA